MRLLALMLALLATPLAADAPRSMILASTTSTQNSGLLDAILPVFEAQTGIHVYVVAVGTGQALRIARSGDADALLVHHRPSEEAFIAAGYGLARRDVMFNDFVIVGPKGDAAGISEATSAVEAFTRIAAAQVRFVSRGDDSGTHLREQSLWTAAGVDPTGEWYLEVGSGMGTSLNLASGLSAYILSDRGTWLSFGNRGDLELLYAGDPVLFNPYGIIVVNPERFAHVNATEANALADWLVSEHGQAAIGAFVVNGEQLFCPDALTTQNQPQNDNSTCAAHALQR